MTFSKWHALGNTYLLVERAETGALNGARARALCDPHRGVGADGVLVVQVLGPAEADVEIWNPDGSRAELSGNGARIAARWLSLRSGREDVLLHVGPRPVRARVQGLSVEAEVGPVRVSAPETIGVDGEEIELTAVSVGNPHAVIRREPVRSELVRLGPAVERHPRFPQRTNVQLVRVDGRNELTVAVWERGAGETQSSGSSATAAAAAAVANGWATSPVTVHLPGGDLRVELGPEGQALLTGPAEEIFRGELV